MIKAATMILFGRCQLHTCRQCHISNHCGLLLNGKTDNGSIAWQRQLVRLDHSHMKQSGRVSVMPPTITL